MEELNILKYCKHTLQSASYETDFVFCLFIKPSYLSYLSFSLNTKEALIMLTRISEEGLFQMTFILNSYLVFSSWE